MDIRQYGLDFQGPPTRHRLLVPKHEGRAHRTEVPMDNTARADRIARLERSNRRQRLWLFALTLGFLVGVFFQPFSVVRDLWSGQMVAVTTTAGTAVQGFWNTRKERRLELGVVKVGEPAIYLLGQDERLRIGLDLQPEPTLTFRDQANAARIRLTLSEDGSPRLSLINSSGKGGVFLGTLADDTPLIRCTDKLGNVIFQVPEAGSQ